MTSGTYIIQSVPWILAGLLTGFFMGRSTVVVEAVVDAVQAEGDTVTDAKPKRFRFTGMHVLGVVVAVLGVFTAVQSYVQGEATDRLVVCTKAYQDGFADALDERQKATSEAQDALDDLLTKVAAITPSPEGRQRFRDALAEYLEKRAAAKQAQRDHPYPPAPRDVCEEP